MIARSNSVQAIGDVCLVSRDIQRDGFEVRELGPIARLFARSTIGEVALVHADGDIVGFCIGEIGAVAGFQPVLAG